jgi:hypothetical protein
MKSRRIILAASAALLLHLTAFSEDPAPKLVLSQAAKMAEDAVAKAGLAADRFVRSVTLVQPPKAAPYYRVTYRPLVIQRAEVGGDSTPGMLDVIHVSMDGKVSFEQEEMRRRVRTINK